MRPFYLIPQEEWFSGHQAPLDHEQVQREQIRQWFLRELQETYGYPYEWLQARVIFDMHLASGNMQRRFDVVITNRLGEPYIVLIIKLKSSLNDVGGANDQLRSIIGSVPSLLIGVATNSEDVFIWNKKENSVLQLEKSIIPYHPPQKTPGMLPTEVGLELLLQRISHFIHFLQSQKKDNRDIIAAVTQLLLLKMYDESIKSQGYSPIIFAELYSSTEEFYSSLESLWHQWLTLHNTGRSSGGALFSTTLFTVGKAEFAQFLDSLRDVPCYSLLVGKFPYMLSIVLEPLLQTIKGKTQPLSQTLLNEVVRMACPQQSDRVLDLTCFNGEVVATIAKYYAIKPADTLFQDLSLLYAIQGIASTKLEGQVAFLRLFLEGYSRPQISFGAGPRAGEHPFDAIFCLQHYPKLRDGADSKLYETDPMLAEALHPLRTAISLAKTKTKLVFSLPSFLLTDPRYFRIQRYLLQTLQLTAVVALPPEEGIIPTSVLFAKLFIDDLADLTTQVLFAEITAIDELHTIREAFLAEGDWR